MNEFPINASVWEDDLNRRDFLKLMAASIAFATGCGMRMPEEKIVPYARQPEEIIPGKALYFATAMTLGGYATGLLVESHEGRPTKIEGNPLHPASLGATGAFEQASILTLYDPNRSQVVTHNGQVSTWGEFITALPKQVRILTEAISSPTLMRQLSSFHWHSFEPFSRDNPYEGARLAFGEPVETRYRLDQADVILTLDSDFLTSGPGWIRYAREFIDRRRVRADTRRMNRLYVVEPTPTATGAMADHRMIRRASEMGDFLRNQKIAADLIIVGDQQPPIIHALAHQHNAGKAVTYTKPVIAHGESLRALIDDMDAGKVDALLILGGNPVATAPGFAEALSKVKFRAHLSLYEDETSRLCDWHIPEAHYLETWSDARAFDGTVTIQQPLIAPLYDGKSAHALLTLGQTSHDIVRETWKQLDDDHWHAALHDGVVPGTAFEPKPVKLRNFKPEISNPKHEIEILFRPDPTTYDGRFTHNGWLQELPKPLTRLTWDSPALLSPATATKLGVNNGDVIEIGHLRLPVWLISGQADQTIVLNRQVEPGVEVRKTGERRELACTQHHHSMEGRDLVRVGTLDQFPSGNKIDHPSLYPGFKYDGHAWGMVIDLTACVGCSACVVACQAENNIPIVGKQQVARGREMHWIRVDRYWEDEQILFQPVPCMHCENAPCELVCPVNATNHTEEGLNAQIYNRCIGTRYCSNNCPYKVRRFNFLQYSDLKTPSLKMLNNPNVTVRNRGVMEKCTYCVQRIQEAKITAENQDRPIRDGEIVPACAQACPTQAIVFGDLNDPNSRVAQLKAQPHNYGLLVDLNTRPRTTYLARIRNPNSEIKT